MALEFLSMLCFRQSLHCSYLFGPARAEFRRTDHLAVGAAAQRASQKLCPVVDWEAHVERWAAVLRGDVGELLVAVPALFAHSASSASVEAQYCAAYGLALEDAI